MPDDPAAKRTTEAPVHPAGYAASDDAPIHVAPAIDLRASNDEESTWARRPPETVPFEPRLPDADATLVPSADEPPTPHQWLPPDDAADDGERAALAAAIGEIGAVPSEADRATDRDLSLRATLARARALHFRRVLLDAWGISPSLRIAAPTDARRPLPLDLAVDAAMLVALSNGAALDDPDRSFAFVRPLVTFLRRARPDLTRSTLRDRGATSIARLTLIGWAFALASLADAARSLPLDARRTCLALAARIALAPAIDDDRLAALGDLERALALPTASVADALDGARTDDGERAALSE